MVVRRWLCRGLLLGWLVGWLGPAIAADLPVTLDHARIERGRWVIATIHDRAPAPSLETLDLSPWEENFHVERLGLDSVPSAEQRLRLRLYPRRTGSLILPALDFHGRQTRPVRLQVDADHRGDETIDLSTRISTTTPWERQQIRVMLTVTTPDEFASLRTGELRLPGFEVTPLPFTRVRHGGEPTRLQLGWALHPLHAGKSRLRLPPAEYRRGGGTERRWYLPPLKLAVRPLPRWLPPTIPVGSLHLESRLEPGGPLLTTGRLATWQLTLRSPDIPPAWLPAILRQVRSNARIRLFPPASQREIRPDPGGIHSQVIHRLPFKPLTDGRLDLPALQIRWFDPGDGRLHSLLHVPERPLSLRRPLQWLLLALLAGLLWLPGRKGIRGIRQARRRRRWKRQALAEIAAATRPLGLRQALALYGRALNWPANLTLTAWGQRWKETHATGPDFDARMQRLRRACYGPPASLDMESLREGLLADLRAPRKRRRRRQGSITTPDHWLDLEPDRPR